MACSRAQYGSPCGREGSTAVREQYPLHSMAAFCTSRRYPGAATATARAAARRWFAPVWLVADVHPDDDTAWPWHIRVVLLVAEVIPHVLGPHECREALR